MVYLPFVQRTVRPLGKTSHSARSRSPNVRWWLDSAVAILSLIAIGCDDAPKDQVEDYIEVGMYQEAESLLSERIRESPKNAQLHFLLGRVRRTSGNSAGAEEAFRRATRLEPDIGEEIGELYLNLAMESIADDNLSEADRHLQYSGQYAPDMKDRIGEYLAESAVSRFEAMQFGTARQLAMKAVDRDPDQGSEIADAALSVGADLDCRSDLNRRVEAANIAASVDHEGASASGDLIWECIVELKESLGKDKLQTLGAHIVEWSPEHREELVDIYFSKARKALTEGKPDVGSTRTYLRAAVETRNSESDQAGKLVWSVLSNRLNQLPELGEDRFLDLFDLVRELGLPSSERTSPAYLLASGLAKWANGSRQEAVDQFRRVQRQYANTTAGQQAEIYLSLPEPGIREFSFDEWHFEDTRKSPPLGRSDGVLIRPVRADVKANDINLIVSVKATNTEDILLYAPERTGGGYGAVEPPYLVDNLGKKLVTTSGFIGGRQSQFNDKVRQINLNPGEQVILNISFPMVSPGATTVKFMSPTLNGWQPDWSWDGIELKPGPFEQ